MRYVFIINPVAGKMNAEENLKNALSDYFSGREDTYSVFITAAKGDAYNIAKSEAEKGDEVRIFACGGDGTVFEVLNGLVGYDNASLGVVPVGSANDFLKYFDEADKSAFLSIEQQIKGESVPCDLIKVEDKYSLNICSVGMDAIVADGMSAFKKWPLVSGPMAYKLSLAKVFLGKIGMNFKLTIDGEEIPARDYLFALCANGPCYGGGWRSAPDANPFDNVLNFVTVEKISKLKILAFLGDYKNGKVAKYPFSRTGMCSEMIIESDKPFPVNLDGEIMRFKRAVFSLVKDGVKFVVPKALLSKVRSKILTI